MYFRLDFFGGRGWHSYFDSAIQLNYHNVLILDPTEIQNLVLSQIGEKRWSDQLFSWRDPDDFTTF